MNTYPYIKQRLAFQGGGTLDLEPVLNGMTDAFLVLDKEWRICFMNREAARINGKAPEEALGKTHWEEWPGSIGTPIEAAYRKAMSEQIAVHLEHHYQDATHDVWLEINVYPTADNLGIFYRDIGERKRTEQALQHSEARFRAAVLAVGDIVWTNSPSGQMEGEQAGWAAFTGQSYAEYQGYGWANAVHPDDAQPTIDAWNEAVAERKMFVFEHRLKRADGAWRHFAICGVPVLNADGSIREWVGVHTDLTQQRLAQQEIRDLNVRLQRAMTETHHRVKNNLQLVSSLIDLQRLSGKATVPMSELERLGANVRALGSIHDLLTQEAKAGGDQKTLSGREVLESLLEVLRQTMGDRVLKSSLDEVRLTGKQSTALTLVTNELISNALKHGKGEIEIDFRVQDDLVTLEVCDDGPGFAEGFDVETQSHTGLELVEQMVTWDLGGRLECLNRSEGGARMSVTFPIKKEANAVETASPSQAE